MIKSTKPDAAFTSYDAIFVFKQELCIFKDEYFWRVSKKGVLEGYPQKSRNLWTALPKHFKKIDAAYVNQNEIKVGVERAFADISERRATGKVLLKFSELFMPEE